MPVDVNKITESRRAQREATQTDARAAIALEQIADTLEALRAEFVGFTVMMERISRPPPR